MPVSSSKSPVVDLVVPVLNEAHVLERSIGTIRRFLHEEFPYAARIVIADNGSADGTGDLADRLAEQLDDVRCLRISQRGRGRALREAWSQSDADIMAYTDVDISTELHALERLCYAIWEKGYDLGTGSRLLPRSQVVRGVKREFISRSYNLLIKAVLWTHFSDAQCGFKAVSRRVAHELVPLVKDNAWFFDTELLVLAEKLGYRIADVPVRWVDDDDSRVKILSTAWEDVKGVLRVRRELWTGAHRRNKVTRPTPVEPETVETH